MAFSRTRPWRAALAAIATMVLLAVPAAAAMIGRGEDSPPAPLPIVFVHGNGIGDTAWGLADTASVWAALEWRFESNGYPADRLFAVSLRFPTARLLDDVPQPGTSSTTEVRDQLAAFVQRVLRRTGARQVILVGNSRGGNTIRNYLKNGGGAAVTAKVILGAGISHGIYANGLLFPTNEFNSDGPFLKQLNAGPNEVVDGVDFLTIRSDKFDKFAQPNVRFLRDLLPAGTGVVIPPDTPSGVSFDAPALNGAKNKVLPGVDHREAALSPEAFRQIYKFVTGKAPKTLDIVAEDAPVLRGVITGVTAGQFDNQGVAGADLKIFEVDAKTGERKGGAAYHVVTAGKGAWGPFTADPEASYEFLLKAPGQPTTHIYHGPFPRSVDTFDLRAARSAPDTDGKLSTIVISRSSGYFGVEDTVTFDGVRPDFSTDPVPNVDTLTVTTPVAKAAHTAVFDGESITVRNWPKGHVTVVAFTH